ncbi:hypothetical protein A5634_21575 [Mycobacterium asiaticum]|uniref:TPR repeat domain-containing protein n=1 Tax=Mycobacterium asiaticum TaxID=1790 RepID=A0A1A3P108_MYCAS|nr:hypothetical protein [Mycobacterium asiaticum]OBK27943.1 hypothetical protein A5634_21575 [Mycobacterium asiaticum]
MVTRRQIDAANPQAVLGMIDSWKRSATDMLDNATTYRGAVTMPGGQPWSGQTRDAVVAMAGKDYTAIDGLHESVNRMSDAAAHGINDSVIPSLNDVRAKIAAAEHEGFRVNDDLSVAQPQAPIADIIDPKKKEQGERYEREIKAAAQKWWDAEQAVARQIDNDKNGLAAALNAVGALNANEGGGDGTNLVNNHFLSSQEQQRLLAAGTLTPDQLARLARGERVEVGAGRMAYLYQMSQALNGKSPAEIKALMDGLSPQSRAALSQGLAIVSNHHALSGVHNPQGVTDATREDFIPAAGSLANLPKGIVSELTRTDRITKGINADGLLVGTTNLHGVAGLQDLAEVFRPAGTAYLNGSEATQSMLAAASQYAAADAGVRGDPHAAIFSDQHGASPAMPSDPRGALAGVIAVAGNDHVGMHDLATGANSHEFLQGLLQENWGSHSDQVGNAFRWMGDDPHNPINSGTADAVSHYISDPANDFKHMPGGGNFGADNPALAQALAKGIGPYLASLAGADASLFDTPGIHPFDNQGQMANLFAVLDQDHIAGATINNAAAQLQQYLEVNAAQTGHYYGAEIAERLHAAMNQGGHDYSNFSQLSQVYAANQANAARGALWDTGYGALAGVAGFVPEAKLPAAMAAVMNPEMKLGMLNPVVDPTTIAGDHYITNWLDTHGPNNPNNQHLAILQGLINGNPIAAHDPALTPYLTHDDNGLPTIDHGKVFYDFRNNPQSMDDWYNSVAARYGFNPGLWASEHDAGGRTDWGPPR